MSNLAIIPARSDSKSVPDKNIHMLAGKPLLAWSIEHALQSKLIDRTIVSTDSEPYARIARDFGAQTPFLRPPELARDDSTDLEVFLHALDWLKRHEGYVPDICVNLRPTYPVREPNLIDDVVQTLVDRPELDSVRTVTEVLHPPYKMWFRDDDGLLSPVVPTEIAEASNLPRQLLPRTYLQNACIDAIRVIVITADKSMVGKRVFGYVMSHDFDIDTLPELRRAGEHLTGSSCRPPESNSLPEPCDAAKTFCFDIDGVIATLVPQNDYNLAQPQPDMVEKICKLYEKGHRIVLYTARGSATGIDWRELTVEQLWRWGVKYHELYFGKPAADYYIDDRMLAMEEVAGLAREASSGRVP